MPLKSYVRLGQYGRKKEEPLLWRVVKEDERGQLLLADKVLCLKAFDVTSDQSSYGSNKWPTATIRTWLNSDAKAGEVDFGSHPKPTADRIYQGEYPYDDEKGFLANFSPAEKALIQEVETLTQSGFSKLKNLKKFTTETTRDKVFLLSAQEFHELDSDLKKGVLAEQIKQECPELNVEKWEFWARTPNLADYGVYLLDHGSGLGMSANSSAYCAFGIRPGLYLSKDAKLTGEGTMPNPLVVDGAA